MQISDLKLKEDMREIEDLVFQIKYFAEGAQPAYSAPMIRNLAKAIAHLLKIETKDIEHLFEQENKRWDHKAFVAKKKLDSLHKNLEAEDTDSIKNKIEEILNACSKILEKSITLAEFREKIGKACARILKLIDSEHHEMKLVKEFFKMPKDTRLYK
ncbi:MAG: hypothetical protein HY438_01560 [DPANN group archaeon]|nr:hypothetical protein [DPANN group archaeon]